MNEVEQGISDLLALYENSQAENERLLAENASLKERVRRWEPMADPAQFGSGSTR